MEYQIESCRKLRPYSKLEYFKRFMWTAISPFFRYSPRRFFAWRNFLLRTFGAEIGKNVCIYPSAKIYLPWKLSIGDFSSIGEWSLIYNLGNIKIGRKVTISHLTHLCAGSHNYKSKKMELIRSSIVIRDSVWVCSNSVIYPNVELGTGSIISAGSVVVENTDSWTIVRGNPAIHYKNRLKLEE